MLLSLKMENVQHHVCVSIQQHDIAANHKMRISSRRRRQTLLKLLRARNHLLPQSGRKVVAMFGVPAAYFVTVAIAVIMTVPVFVLVAVFVVAATVAVSLPLSKGHTAGKRERRGRAHV